MNRLILKTYSDNHKIVIQDDELSDLIDQVESFLSNIEQSQKRFLANNAIIELVSNLNFYSEQSKGASNSVIELFYNMTGELIFKSNNLSNLENKNELEEKVNRFSKLPNSELNEIYTNAIKDLNSAKNNKNGLGVLRCFLCADNYQLDIEQVSSKLFILNQEVMFKL